MRPSVEIIRLETSYEHGTFGVLRINKQVLCVTLEPRDAENAQNISSIPAGQYVCKRYSSLRYPDTFQVMNVPDRFFILFHAGNVDDDTEGCILVGSSVVKFKNGDRAVLNSGLTFKMFMNALAGCEEFILTIHEKY